MALNIEAVWSSPIQLRLATSGAIYECENPDEIPAEAGVYVFGREHGNFIAPLYIGKALNLRRRIDQQLNSVKLMRGIQEAERGARFLLYCTLLLKQGQKARRVIGII
jgi:hypothetical protein